MKEMDINTLLKEHITPDELANSLTAIYMRFAELRLCYPDTINHDDYGHLYEIRTLINALRDTKNK